MSVSIRARLPLSVVLRAGEPGHKPGTRNTEKLHYERYDGEPLSAEYQQSYWGSKRSV